MASSDEASVILVWPYNQRAFLGWQMPWFPPGTEGLSAQGAGPWLRMFQNARTWAEKN
jgi:phosphoribosylformylglycinamidine synthase